MNCGDDYEKTCLKKRISAGKLRREISLASLQSNFFKHLLRIQRVLADLQGQLHIFQGGKILDQIVKLKHKADIVMRTKPAVQTKDVFYVYFS